VYAVKWLGIIFGLAQMAIKAGKSWAKE